MEGFPNKIIIKLIMVSPLLFVKKIYKKPKLVPTSLTNLLQAIIVSTQLEL
jgi:hypothetical protein